MADRAATVDPFAYLLSLEKFGIKFGLANIRALCLALGQPQTSYRSVLVAGTNGKGSVTAMVDCGLRAAGLKVGRYTSPHLVRLEERFAIDGVPVATEALADAIEHVRGVVDRLIDDRILHAPPTFFEVTTAVAFEIFRREGVKFAVLEVGLGGRLDATNCVEPVVAAITSIAFDHEQYLGSTLAAIAGEKAGVVRRGIPVVIGPLDPEAHNVIAAACASAGARMVDAADRAEMTATSSGGRAVIAVKTPAEDYGHIRLGLRGAHQVSNALVALAVLEELAAFAPVGRDAIIAGLRDVKWPGRLDWIDLPGGRRVLLDAAHNPAGALALTEYLGEEVGKPLPLVFGAMKDKDATEMLKRLLPAAAVVIFTQPKNERARPAADLAVLARTIDPASAVEVEPDPEKALQRAWTYGAEVCVAGSIFLIGDVLERLDQQVRHT